jgi:hypothetical protein
MAIWKAPPGDENRWGFDGNEKPPWLMVHLAPGGGKQMYLDSAAGKILRSTVPHIAEVSDHGTDGSSRVAWIEGRLPGRARIEVLNPSTGAVEAVLSVRVKRKIFRTISFYFVEDKGGEKTTRQPAIIDNLITQINDIFESQANVVLESGGFQNIKLDFHLTDVVTLYSSSRMEKLYREDMWNKVFRMHRGGFYDLSVFFVPVPIWHGDRNDVVFTKDNNCIVEDGAMGPEYVVPHAIGRMLGCLVTSDPNKINHLMFWDPGSATSIFPRSDNFIPKSCINILNP